MEATRMNEIMATFRVVTPMCLGGAKTVICDGHFGRAEDGTLGNLHDEVSAYTREQRKRERSEASLLSPEPQVAEDFREQFEAAYSSDKLAVSDPVNAKRQTFTQQAAELDQYRCTQVRRRHTSCDTQASFPSQITKMNTKPALPPC